jgi:hypothetical protein
MRHFHPSLSLVIRLFVLIALFSTALEARVLWADGAYVQLVLIVLGMLPVQIIFWAAAPEIAERLRDMGPRR